MLKIRLGALPETEVKIPQFPPGKLAQPLRPKSVRRSCHTGKMVSHTGPMFGGAGRQAVMVAARLINRHEVQPSVGADIHAVKRLVI